MNRSFSNFITSFFDKATQLMAYLLFLVIIYKYAFVSNDSIMIITYKEFYIIEFVSIISAILLSLSTKEKSNL